MALKNVGAGGIDWESVGGEKWYTLQLSAPIEDAEPGLYGPNMLWKFWVWDGDTLLTEDDEAWWQWSGTSMGKRATARKWIEALLGREAEKGESGEALAEEAVECYMRAFIAPNDNGTWKIDRVKPFTGSAEQEAEPVAKAAPPKAAPAAAPKAAPGKPAAAAKPSGPGKAPAKPAAAAAPVADEPDDLPF
jgi:hypothetical protein